MMGFSIIMAHHDHSPRPSPVMDGDYHPWKSILWVDDQTFTAYT
jgi:hypothetical protein